MTYFAKHEGMNPERSEWHRETHDDTTRGEE